MAVIATMVLPKAMPSLPELKGGAAATLVGGMAAMLMILATLAAEGPRRILDASAEHITDGFVFAFKAMGSVLQSAQHLIPPNHTFVAFGVLLVGMITGIDGSGFAGLPLTGTLSRALAPAAGTDPATLAAVGQMGAVWTGGGTLIAWSSLIAVAGFARVPVLAAVRALLFPVLTGLVVSTVCAVMLWP